jgi:curved DNA-binding protein CbpA
MQHMKRSSIYVSDASILLSHKNPILSPMSPADSLSPTTDAPDFIDHYANLELGSNASIDEVKAAFRRLRGQYFTTNAVKYRAAQAAFDVLANPAARQDYDSLYRARPSPNTLSLDEIMESSKHGRTDSAHGDDTAMPVVSEEEEAEAARSQDPNWGLKQHRRLYEPVMGTQPYASYVPILIDYDGFQRHPVLGCRRPVYVGEMASYSRPN